MRLAILFLIILVSGCSSMAKDIENYDKNYEQIPLHLVTLGDAKASVAKTLGAQVNVIGSKRFAAGSIEVWEYEKWFAEPLGPDYREEVYWMYFLNGKLEQWGRPGDWQREADRIYESRMK